MNNLSKLQWACRRGMLELDILLSNFLKTHYPALSEQQQNDFASLLTFSDPELHSWLMGFEQPPSESISTIVALIRNQKKLHVSS